MEDDGARLGRARALMAIRSRGALTLVSPDGSLHRLDGPSADLAEAVLAFCARAARTRTEILAHVEALTGEALEDHAVVEAAVDLLAGRGALVPATPSPAARPRGPGARVLLGLSGAVASAHAPSLVQRLQARGFEVRVAATPNALRFAAREALEALTHHPVTSSIWDRDGGLRVPHVELAEWADLVALWPASAALISRIAAGDCSELLSAIGVTTRAPVLVAPSMNHAMYDAPAAVRNRASLREDGFYLAPPAFAEEVADAPADRAPALGGAPGPAHFARLIEATLRLHRATHPTLPRDAAGWEALHRRVPEREQAWFTTEVDPQIAAALRAHAPPPGLLWDVGTGHGATAIWAADQGYQVVATDIASTALERARARAADRRITFLCDDVADSALRTPFDVIVDRGTLHALSPDRRSAYARRMVECARPGGIVIVKVHAAPDERVVTHPLTVEALDRLLGPALERVAAEPGELVGALEPAPAAVMAVFRRAHPTSDG